MMILKWLCYRDITVVNLCLGDPLYAMGYNRDLHDDCLITIYIAKIFHCSIM
jgi:hypothetical protein